jgi:predicted transcriptional regulator
MLVSSHSEEMKATYIYLRVNLNWGIFSANLIILNSSGFGFMSTIGRKPR